MYLVSVMLILKNVRGESRASVRMLKLFSLSIWMFTSLFRSGFQLFRQEIRVIKICKENVGTSVYQ